MSTRGTAARSQEVKRASGSGKASKAKVGVEPGAITKGSPREYAIRFVFGALISVVAALVGMRLGPRVGGVFLAFPAILPASLTLLEQHEGEGAADADTQGGILGGIGMVFFAAIIAFLARTLGAPLALAVALAAWILVSAGLYLLLRRAWPKAWR